MLISFSVENYLSFNEMQTISLEASRDTDFEQNVTMSAQGTKLNLLNSAAVYGPNASGKSNLLEAMSLMRNSVLQSAKGKPRNTPTGAVPFKLAEANLQEPSTFVIEFLSNGVRYLYGFSLLKERIHEEWLYSYPENRKRVLFSRDHKDGVSDEIEQDYYWGPSWAGEAKRLAKITRPDVLFLSVASEFNHETARIIVDWFHKCLRGVQSAPHGAAEEAFTLEVCENDSSFKIEVLKFLHNADLAINDFTIRKRPLRESVYFNLFPPEIIDSFLKDIGADPEAEEFREPIFVRNGTGHDESSMPVQFEASEESEGTRKFFALAGPILYALENGCCLFADELDTRLHPLLTQAIIELFHDPEINSTGAQLVFATHDANLLEIQGLFRRDQIWLAEKDETGATALNSLWDYKIRKGENLKKGYLAGRYGAVPFIERLIESPPNIEMDKEED